MTSVSNQNDTAPLTAGCLPETHWRTRAEKHTQRAHALTAAHLARRARGIKHPIEDFLFTYYSMKPAELGKWHPGAGIVLEGAACERASWRYYTVPSNTSDAMVDTQQFFQKRAKTVDYIADLLRKTLTRTPRFGCFGLHEWAMVSTSLQKHCDTEDYACGSDTKQATGSSKITASRAATSTHIVSLPRMRRP